MNMTSADIWDALNTLARAGVVAILIYKMIWLSPKFTPIEMAGMGTTASGCFMTMAVIWAPESPFRDWASTLFSWGVLLYFVGRMTRHRWNNREQRKIARRHFARKAER
jgi:hypothetical protein